MTYYSRSRQCLWTKGETSGHFQYVKSLTIDCDKDTLLAKVEQIGAAAIPEIRLAFSRLSQARIMMKPTRFRFLKPYMARSWTGRRIQKKDHTPIISLIKELIKF